MSDLVVNPEDRFSHNEAPLITERLHCPRVTRVQQISDVTDRRRRAGPSRAGGGSTHVLLTGIIRKQSTQDHQMCKVTNSSNTNQAVQPQKMARNLKFQIMEVEGLYLLCSKNKGVDQQ